MKRLAIIGVGIVGTGAHGQGIPGMVNGLMKLSETNSITVYSFVPVDKTRVPKGIRIRCTWSTRKSLLRIQFVGLALLFVLDHIIKRYDLIHAQSPYPAGVLSSWLNKFFNIPWVLSLHAGEVARMPDVPFGDLLNPHLSKAAFDVCPRANLIMAMSRFQADIALENLNIDLNIAVLHRGIEAKAYKRKPLCSPIQFLHISNYHPVKDYGTLFKTFSLLLQQMDCELVIAGDNNRVEIIDIIASMRLNDKIKFVGTIPNEKLTDLFSTAHILLHTSRFEGLPMVALEAMAHGVLICGTHVGVMADFSGKYCLTVPPGDFMALAETAAGVVKNEARYHALCEQAYAFIKTRDQQWYVNE
ncbi:MAG TPA: glycosyltransferase family 4 protein, partial [Chryseolinea sp.]